MRKQYFKLGPRLEEIQTESATEAMRWHRSGGNYGVFNADDGNLYAQFSTEKQAARWVDFITGRRNNK